MSANASIVISAKDNYSDAIKKCRLRRPRSGKI